MRILIDSAFAFNLRSRGDVLLQFEAAAIPEQRILSSETRLTPSHHQSRVPAQDDVGERIWIRAEGQFEVGYRAEIEIERKVAEVASLDALPHHILPGETVQYLFDSRYCPATRFQYFVEAQFGRTRGGARIAAIRDWIADNLAYERGSSGSQTDALDSFVERRGICRDFAHLLVTMARASAIPARFVACYAPGVTPQDFHALAEVFLCDPDTDGGGTWQIVDATGMADPAETVKIGIGRDAADVSFMTSFADSSFSWSEVDVRRAETVDEQDQGGSG
ncbi:transglutaminase family protein [Qipengyuania sp.]|uniref:transglutaminase-like domain-containing protein n=1 Tax=Qipengyuania sp. TaxID=2004515 RepID=UPI0037354176